MLRLVPVLSCNFLVFFVSVSSSVSESVVFMFVQFSGRLSAPGEVIVDYFFGEKYSFFEKEGPSFLHTFIAFLLDSQGLELLGRSKNKKNNLISEKSTFV